MAPPRPSPELAAGGSGGGGSHLDRKMELLEARFVSSPIGGADPLAEGHSSPVATLAASAGTGAESSRGATPVRSNRQPAWQAALQHQTQMGDPIGANSNQSGSQHSFSFERRTDASGLASSSPVRALAAVAESNRQVHLAAERHMAKVGRERNIPPGGGGGSVSSVPPSDPEASHSSNGEHSNATLLTGHISATQQQQLKQKQPQSPNPARGKRKSITPSKRDKPSVREAGSRRQQQQKTNNSAASPPSLHTAGARKRGRLMSKELAVVTGAAPCSASALSTQDGLGNSHQGSRSGSGSNSGGGSLSAFLQRGGNRSNQGSRRGGVGGGGGSTALAAGASSSSAARVTPPNNNTKIHDFFGTVKKRVGGDGVAAAKGKLTSGARVARTPEEGQVLRQQSQPRPSGGAGEGVSPPSPTGNAMVPAQQRTAAVVMSPHSSALLQRELTHAQQRCLELERSLADRSEQLRAVANNQTMFQASLRSSLVQREAEIEKLKEGIDKKAAAVSVALERLVRNEAAREAVELRQKLASEGGRLGQIVYTRAGMHSVESWEDGPAFRALKKRRLEMKEKRHELEKREAAALSAAAEFRTNATGQDEASTEDNSNSCRVGGILVRDAFDLAEAEQAIRLHLANLENMEKRLDDEDQGLVAEKEAHIRSLKCVASEDASRFKHRPRLHDRYIPISQLGKGGFSEVWRAYDLVDLKEVAVKIHQLDPRWSDAKKENYTKHVSREYEIHRGVRHPRIVSLFDVFEIDTNSFATVLEICEGTDLDTLLKKNKRLTEQDARAILLQILSGMRYLSSSSSDGSRQSIIHYDLKPGNILFDKNGDAKITDFGLSKIVDAADPTDSMELTSQGAGTYWYLPPECFITHQNVRISNKVDVWSIGVIYYQMLFGKRPFGDGMSQDKVLSNNIMLGARDVPFPTSPKISDGAKDFIRQCLTYDQTFRPNISQLCTSPYLHQVI